MKSANLASRIEWLDEPAESPPRQPTNEPRDGTIEPARARPRFEHRTIEIRDQGFALFRVR